MGYTWVKRYLAKLISLNTSKLKNGECEYMNRNVSSVTIDCSMILQDDYFSERGFNYIILKGYSI